MSDSSFPYLLCLYNAHTGRVVQSFITFDNLLIRVLCSHPFSKTGKSHILVFVCEIEKKQNERR